MGLLQLAGQVGSRFLQRAGTKIANRYGGKAAGVVLAGSTVAAGTVAGNRLSGGWQDMGPARRRRKGLSGRDIQGAQRVMQLVSTFGYKPKLPCRRKGRKCR